jgi:hypothetical protein
MPFDRALWPSEAAIIRVLDVTDRQLVPADLDIAALRADLNQCRMGFLAKQIDTAEFSSSYKKAATETIKHARALRQLMASSGNRLFDLRLFGVFDEGVYNHLFAVLGTVISETKKIASRGIDVVHDSPSGRKDYLVRLLVPIYERHFKRPAGREGPFSRFVEAVSVEMGRSTRVSRHTTRKSLSTARRGKT